MLKLPGLDLSTFEVSPSQGTAYLSNVHKLNDNPINQSDSNIDIAMMYERLTYVKINLADTRHFQTITIAVDCVKCNFD